MTTFLHSNLTVTGELDVDFLGHRPQFKLSLTFISRKPLSSACVLPLSAVQSMLILL